MDSIVDRALDVADFINGIDPKRQRSTQSARLG